MAEDDVDGIFFQCFFQDDPGICDGTRHASGADDLEMEDLIRPVQEYHGEDFMRQAAGIDMPGEPEQEEFPCAALAGAAALCRGCGGLAGGQPDAIAWGLAGG